MELNWHLFIVCRTIFCCRKQGLLNALLACSFLVGSAHPPVVELKQSCNRQAGNKAMRRRWALAGLSSALLWAMPEPWAPSSGWLKGATYWQSIAQYANWDSFGDLCVYFCNTCKAYTTPQSITKVSESKIFVSCVSHRYCLVFLRKSSMRLYAVDFK